MTLYQEENDDKMHSVAFDERKLHEVELNYSMHEKKLLTIKDILRKWHHYIENGLLIIIITNHDSLKYMNTIQNSSKYITRWIEEFQ